MSEQDKDAFRARARELGGEEVGPAVESVSGSAMNVDAELKADSQDVEAEPPTNVDAEFPRLTIPQDYAKDALVSEYKGISKSHELRVANDQARWELYGNFVLLLRRGDVQKGSIKDKLLQPLHLSRNKLSEVLRYVGEGAVPASCPPPFRSGRSPELRLTEQENNDVLNLIMFHADTGQAKHSPCNNAILL